MSAPVTMKKGRLGTLLTVLCRPEDRGRLEKLLFRETTTLEYAYGKKAVIASSAKSCPLKRNLALSG